MMALCRFQRLCWAVAVVGVEAVAAAVVEAGWVRLLLVMTQLLVLVPVAVAAEEAVAVWRWVRW